MFLWALLPQEIQFGGHYLIVTCFVAVILCVGAMYFRARYRLRLPWGPRTAVASPPPSPPIPVVARSSVPRADDHDIDTMLAGQQTDIDRNTIRHQAEEIAMLNADLTVAKAALEQERHAVAEYTKPRMAELIGNFHKALAEGRQLLEDRLADLRARLAGVIDETDRIWKCIAALSTMAMQPIDWRDEEGQINMNAGDGETHLDKTIPGAPRWAVALGRASFLHRRRADLV